MTRTTATALRRHLDRRSRPVFAALAAEGRGLAAVAGFVAGLVDARCRGPHARWGCMAANAHALLGTGTGGDDAAVRAVLTDHHDALRTALRTALSAAEESGDLRPGLRPDVAAEQLALLAHGVNLRSRAGAHPDELTAAVEAALDGLRREESR